MSYEQAPATKMLATHCIFCNRPLVDAASVEAGIGPVCRERVGYNEFVSDSVRKQANKLIHFIATNRKDPFLEVSLRELEDLGLTRLALKIEEALAEIKIEERDNKLWVEAPFLDSSLRDWRSIAGRFFDGQSKRNVVPSDQRKALYVLLTKHYKGCTAKGPKGLFVL
jgi:hypothetical protein